MTSSVTAKRSSFLKGGRSIWLNDVEESFDAADEDCLQAAPTHTYPIPDKIGWVWVFLCQYPPGQKSVRVAPATYPPR
eukprot:scaffold1381_cov81-Skeletonema_dohrnii-CCMP3373.AAC.1